MQSKFGSIITQLGMGIFPILDQLMYIGYSILTWHTYFNTKTDFALIMKTSIRILMEVETVEQNIVIPVF